MRGVYLDREYLLDRVEEINDNESVVKKGFLEQDDFGFEFYVVGECEIDVEDIFEEYATTYVNGGSEGQVYLIELGKKSTTYKLGK